MPVLGRDGSLEDILRDSPAAGRVVGKTGTIVSFDEAERRWVMRAKGMVGYVNTIDGRRLSYAVYINDTPLPRDTPSVPWEWMGIIGSAIGEIVEAAYLYPMGAATLQ